MARITFDDKVSIKENNLPRKNQVTADDINEIKSVVNANETATTNTNGIGSWTLEVDSPTNPPSSGGFNFDNASIGSATKFRIHKTDSNGRLVTSIFDNYIENDIIVLLDKTDKTKLITIVLGAKTSNPNDYEFEISTITVVGSFSTNDNVFCLSNKASTGLTWNGDWLEGTTYNKNEIVKDSAFLMRAKRQTNDRPAPTKYNGPSFILDNVPNFGFSPYTDVIRRGIRVASPPRFFMVMGVRIWIDSTDAGTFYQVYSKSFLNGSTRFHGRYNSNDFTSTGWHSVFFEPIGLETTDDTVFIMSSYKQSGFNVVDLEMVYSGNENTPSDPTSGNTNKSTANDVLRISKTDRNAVDISADLEKIISGSAIVMTQDSDGSKQIAFNVLESNNLGNYYELHVSSNPIVSGGIPDVGQNVTYQFNDPIFAEQQIEIKSNVLALVSYYQGYLQSGNDVPSFTQNMYGVDLLIKEMTKSNDWDILSTSAWSTIGANIVAESGTTRNERGNATVTTNTTIDETILNYFVDASSNDVTIWLPSSPSDATKWNIKRIDNSSNVVTIEGLGGRTVDGESSGTINEQYESISVLFDGSQNNYFII